VDAFVWTHRDFVICFAAGNEGSDSAGSGIVAPGSVGSPGTAKNCITVGASENDRPSFPAGPGRGPLTYGGGWSSDFPVRPITADPVADNPEGMAAFSSRGPAANNRVRPDVVAPGTAILSTKSRASNDDGWGAYDADYFYDGGTSMATPLVAGCAAVVREYLVAAGGASPSAALVKAMLINGAHPLQGQYSKPEVNTPPDNSQGFGRVDLASTIGPYPGGTIVVFHDEDAALDTGESKTFQQAVTVGQVLKVTLVWTDPKGEALQNDLDLIVTVPSGAELHGNMPAGSPAFDRTNNVEQVSTSITASGIAAITVRCYRSVLSQSFALVIRTS
jgi:serine protease AprX